MEAKCTRSMAAVVAVVSCLACGGGDDSSGIAIEPFRHLETANTLAPGELEVGAIDYVRSLAAEAGLGLSAGDDFQVRTVLQGSRDGLRHVRLRQTYAGVEVLGSEVVVHADDTTFLGVNGYLTRNLEGFDVTPEVAGDQAVAIAKADRSATGELPFTSESSRLVIAPRAEGGADLAWSIQIGNAGSDPGMWDYLVEARSGAVLRKFDAVPRMEQASGPGGDQSGGWVTQLDVEPVPPGESVEGDVWMKTSRLETYDIAKSKDEPVAGTVAEMKDPFANDAHGYAEVTLDMMRDWYGINSVDGNGIVLKSFINDSSVCPENTACAPLDQKAEVYYTVSWPGAAQLLGVVAHETNHNFTEFHSNLTYSGQGANLHEHFSNVAGAIAEFYRWDGAIHGELDGICNAEPKDSGVPHRAFCLAVGRYKASIGGSTTDAVRAVGGVWYQANGAYWTPSTDFVNACQGTIDAALSLGMGSDFVQGLRDSWADAGVNCAGPESFVCDNDGECDAGDGETCASCPDDCGACSEDCSFWKKAKCKIGIGDCSRCDAVPGCGDGQCDGEETDATCGQDCGCAAVDSCSLAPFGCWCDPACLEYGDCCADVNNSCAG